MRAFAGKLKDLIRGREGPPRHDGNEGSELSLLREQVTKRDQQLVKLREQVTKRDQQLEKLREQVAKKSEHLKRLPKLRKQVIDRNRQLEKLQQKVVQGNLSGDSAHLSDIRPENIVWIIGSPRTGSTWLSRMLGELENCEVWQEPFFGVILSFRDNIANQGWVASQNFILGEPNKPIWLNYMRDMFLTVADVRFA